MLQEHNNRWIGLSMMFLALLGHAPVSFADSKGAPLSPACDRVFSGAFESSAGAGPVVADAGHNFTALAGSEALASGLGQGGQSFCWTLHRKPKGSRATLVSRDAATVRVLTDLAGDYQLNLLVDDGQNVSEIDSVLLSTRSNQQVIGATGGQVLSPDRLVRLDIPAGALATDTIITIDKLNSDELPASLLAASPLATYQFGPDGLVFALPARFTATFNPLLAGGLVPGDQPIVLANMSGDVIEPAAGISNVMERAEVEVVGEVDHFSLLSLIRQPALQVDQDAVVLGLEGRPFTGNYSAIASGPNSVTVVTSAAGPVEVNPDTANPLLADLTHNSLINITHPILSSTSAAFSGRCLRAGTGLVELDLLIIDARLANLPLMPAFDSRMTLRFPVSCFAPEIFNLPRAIDDLVTPPGITPVTIPVLANDVTTGIDLSSVTVIRLPGSGAASANADGSITYTPGPGLSLIDSFDYFFRTAGGLRSNVATVFITPFATVNQLPVAVDDSATTPQDQPLDIAILANDRDEDGTLNPAGVVLINAGTAGQASVNSDGSVTYVAASGFTGVDQFSYNVSDTDGGRSNTAVVRVTVNPLSGPPQAVDDQLLVIQDQTTTLDVLANDTGDIDPFSLSVVQAPISGEVTVRLEDSVAGKGLQTGPGSLRAVIDYVPSAGFIGRDFFTYSIANPTGQIERSALVRVEVSPANNQPPTANNDAAETTLGVPVTIFPLINDVDEDSLLDVNSMRLIAGPDNGQISGAGAGAFQYLPDVGFIGVDVFTYDVADVFLLRSNPAMVAITVAPMANEAPVAVDDNFTLGIDATALDLNVSINDSDPDGNLDLASIVITREPAIGATVIALEDGRIRIAPAAGFTGTFDFTYTISDGITVSNQATVTVTVRSFLGMDIDPTDNISAANTIFVSFFGDAYIDQGTGATVGVSHNEEFPGGNAFIDDYTVLFIPSQSLLRSDPPVDGTLDFSTTNQDFSATYVTDTRRFRLDNLQQDSVFSDFGPDNLTVSSAGAGSFSIDPPAPIRNPDGTIKDLLGDFQGLQTEVVIPPGSGATHLLVRVLGYLGQGNATFAGVTARVPLSTLTPAPDGTLRRPLLTEAARTVLNAVEFNAQLSALVVLYKQADNTAFFDFPGSRTVPLAAGRGFIFPPEQLNPAPALCQNVRRFSLCQGGPNPRILATNGNGNIDVFDSVSGNFVTNFVGDSMPNFTVFSGWHAVQDPLSNCILVSDSGNSTGGAIHQYDTDGRVLTASLIDLPVLGGARGLAFRGGNLLAAIHTQGEIREYNPLTGELLGTILTDLDRPNFVYVDQGDNLYVSDQGESGFNDKVFFYPADGSARSQAIAGGLATPYQISRLQNGNLGLAHFGGGSVRAFSTGFPLIANLLLGNNPDNDMAYQIRGLRPLANGSFLVTADNFGGVAVFDPFSVASGGYDVRREGSSFRFLGDACLNY